MIPPEAIDLAGRTVADELSQPWRVSKSGFTIRCGWEGDKHWIAKYPYAASVPEFSNEDFQKWLELAEHICELHNKSLAKP